MTLDTFSHVTTVNREANRKSAFVTMNVTTKCICERAA